MTIKHWVSWKALTEICIIDYFISNELHELESFTTAKLVNAYGATLSKMRPNNVDIRATINIELNELVKIGDLVKPIRGIYNIAPGRDLMHKLYTKRMELEFQQIQKTI